MPSTPLRLCHTGNYIPQEAVTALRQTASDYIIRHATDLGPFLPLEAADWSGVEQGDYTQAVERYCQRLRTTAAWGGEPELRALACGLKRPIVVYQANGAVVRTEPEQVPEGAAEIPVAYVYRPAGGIDGHAG